MKQLRYLMLALSISSACATTEIVHPVDGPSEDIMTRMARIRGSDEPVLGQAGEGESAGARPSYLDDEGNWALPIQDSGRPYEPKKRTGIDRIRFDLWEIRKQLVQHGGRRLSQGMRRDIEERLRQLSFELSRYTRAQRRTRASHDLEKKKKRIRLVGAEQLMLMAQGMLSTYDMVLQRHDGLRFDDALTIKLMKKRMMKNLDRMQTIMRDELPRYIEQVAQVHDALKQAQRTGHIAMTFFKAIDQMRTVGTRLRQASQAKARLSEGIYHFTQRLRNDGVSAEQEEAAFGYFDEVMPGVRRHGNMTEKELSPPERVFADEGSVEPARAEFVSVEPHYASHVRRARKPVPPMRSVSSDSLPRPSHPRRLRRQASFEHQPPPARTPY